MPYLSNKTILQAWERIANKKVHNKLIGVLGILKSLNINHNKVVAAKKKYTFSSQKLESFLLSNFGFKEEVIVSSNHPYWVIFSENWIQELKFDIQKEGKVSVFDIAILVFQRKNFEKEIDNSEIFNLFIQEFNLSQELVEHLFGVNQDSSIEYVSLQETRDSLKKALNVDNESLTVGLDKKGYKAGANEVSRGPFMQTLYASLNSDKLLIFNDFDFFDSYGFITQDNFIETPLPPINIPLQKILYGPPGTGKSTKIKHLIAEHGFEVSRTTFHPDTDYQSFAGGYKPVVVYDIEKKEDKITYQFVPQAFTKTYVKAHQNPEKSYLLVIEEINRGNCAQIFGDLFQCLDRNDTGQSEYSIEAEADLAKYLESVGLSTQISLPSNLYLYATMNTSDQSLFPMDSAFKRRWDWEYVPIDYAKAAEMSIEIGEKRYNWADFLRKVNEQIETAQNEDKQIGNFFVKPDKPDNLISLEAFKSKVMFYLWSEVFRHETENSIFQYKDDDGNTKTFTFSALFEAGKDIELLHRFMANLGIFQTS